MLKNFWRKGLWQEGRQQGGYRKLSLYTSTTNNWDLHLIRYDKGAFIPLHTDPSPIEGKAHYRFNFTLWKAKEGGREVLSGNAIRKGKRWYLFRPDLISHCVTEVRQGSRWVLSFGFLGERMPEQWVIKHVSAKDLDNGIKFDGEVVIDEAIPGADVTSYNYNLRRSQKDLLLWKRPAEEMTIAKYIETADKPNTGEQDEKTERN